MTPDTKLLAILEAELPRPTRARLEIAVQRIVSAKRRGQKIEAVTGSGPNVHEGVTTLLAELMRLGLIDGVATSSAVVAHEMGGTLDRVKRCAGEPLDPRAAEMLTGARKAEEILHRDGWQSSDFFCRACGRRYSLPIPRLRTVLRAKFRFFENGCRFFTKTLCVKDGPR